MLTIILFLTFVCVSILGYTLVPVLLSKGSKYNQQQAYAMINRADRSLPEEDLKKTYRLMILGPLTLGVAGLVFFPDHQRVIGLFLGVALGYALPRMYINRLIKARKQKFSDQLMDSIMIMSSSFRGGLSLIQAIEAVVDEMPDPSKGEFGIVLGENKMGVALDESLNRLQVRMPSPAMQQMVTAILLARETGGNLPVIFSRIISTMRERKKIEQNLQTLTIQGKIQAAVMTGLPVFFFFGVSASNPHFFDIMLHTASGQKMMMLAAGLWLVGALSILKISSLKEV